MKHIVIVSHSFKTAVPRSRSMTFASLLFLAALLSCGGEKVRPIPCISSQPTLAIEQVSSLEDAYNVEGGSDAVILTEDTSKNPAGSTWSVSTVEVLVMIPDEQFASLPASESLAVEVWDGNDATLTQPWVVTQTFDPRQITWTTVRLQSPQHSSITDYHRGWWRFDFAHVIPESGMTAKSFLVGVHWPRASGLLIGASNFNRPCAQNWTDYADGRGWVLNSNGNNCNWPMLNVNTQVVTLKTTCD